MESEDVADGIGPRVNLDSCVGCHFHPAVGSSSGFVNPQVAFAAQDGGVDSIPFFVAIQEHKSAGNRRFGPSEANKVVNRFNRLREDQKQDLLNFLPSL